MNDDVKQYYLTNKKSNVNELLKIFVKNSVNNVDLWDKTSLSVILFVKLWYDYKEDRNFS